MSFFASCGHKSEWVCSMCASCPVCDRCFGDKQALTLVHINTREAAEALARWSWKRRKELEQEFGPQVDQQP